MTQPTKKQKPKRYSISVTARTYDRLRASMVPTEHASLQKFVDSIIASALNDPMILERVAAKCLG